MAPTIIEVGRLKDQRNKERRCTFLNQLIAFAARSDNALRVNQLDEDVRLDFAPQRILDSELGAGSFLLEKKLRG